MNKLITSVRNPLISKVKSLTNKKGREQNSCILLEGTHLLKEVLRTNKPPKEIILTKKWINSHKEVFNCIPKIYEVYELAESVMHATLTTNNPDGVATIFPIDNLPKKQKNLDFVLALDRLQDPGNLGNLFRTGLAAEVQEIWMASGADPLNQKVIRSSSGAILHMPYKRFAGDEEDAINSLAKELKLAANDYMQIVATIPPMNLNKENITPYWEIDWSKPTILVLGNEASGLHPNLQACCSHRITIPHANTVQSLNVASAAVPILLERKRKEMTSRIHKIK